MHLKTVYIGVFPPARFAWEIAKHYLCAIPICRCYFAQVLNVVRRNQDAICTAAGFIKNLFNVQQQDKN